MDAQQIERKSRSSDGNWLYRMGGMSAILLGIAYLAIIVLYVPLGARPRGVEAWLMSLAGNTAEWWAILALSVLTDFLFVPVALALYLALKGIDKYLMLLAGIFIGLFVVLDLALTWTNYSALLLLSASYAAATDEAGKALISAAAIYPVTVIDSSLLFVYNTLTLSVGILLTGLAMLKGIFSKVTAYLGLAAGVLGIAAVLGAFIASSLSAAIILASLLTTIWVLFTGARLYRLGGQ